jgi:glycosyltransferase involved in cell wall biosynthesis
MLQPNHQIVVLTKANRLEFLGELVPNFVIVETPFEEFTFGEQIGLMRQIKDLEPDLVHFGMAQQPIFYSGKVVTTMHDLTTVRFHNPAKNPIIFWVKQQIYKWVNKRVAHKSVALIVPTEYIKKDVADYAHISPSKITVTLEASDHIDEEAEPILELRNATYLMYIGRPTPHKNLGRLIDAYAELKKTRPGLKLVLAGKKDALYEAHAARAKTAGIDGIVFTGFISDGQLRWLYENCTAYVFPSLSEGFGLPGLEAMEHGAPVVSSNATCLPEVYGDAAAYFNPLDVSDMITKIAEVLDNQKLRQELIEKGSVQAATFSWSRMARQTLAVYETALSKAKS